MSTSRASGKHVSAVLKPPSLCSLVAGPGWASTDGRSASWSLRAAVVDGQCRRRGRVWKSGKGGDLGSSFWCSRNHQRVPSIQGAPEGSWSRLFCGGSSVLPRSRSTGRQRCSLHRGPHPSPRPPCHLPGLMRRAAEELCPCSGGAKFTPMALPCHHDCIFICLACESLKVFLLIPVHQGKDHS